MTQQHVKVRFLLEEGSEAESEGLWALPVGNDQYVLDNAPCYFAGAAAGDCVVATAEDGVLWATALVKAGGHANVWVQSPAEDDDEAYAYLQRMSADLNERDIYCELEDVIPRLVVDLEESDAARQVIQELERLEEAGQLEFAVSNEVSWLE